MADIASIQRLIRVNVFWVFTLPITLLGQQLESFYGQFADAGPTVDGGYRYDSLSFDNYKEALKVYSAKKEIMTEFLKRYLTGEYKLAHKIKKRDTLLKTKNDLFAMEVFLSVKKKELGLFFKPHFSLLIFKGDILSMPVFFCTQGQLDDLRRLDKLSCLDCSKLESETDATDVELHMHSPRYFQVYAKFIGELIPFSSNAYELVSYY